MAWPRCHDAVAEHSGARLQSGSTQVRILPASPPGCSSEAERRSGGPEDGVSGSPIPTTGISSARKSIAFGARRSAVQLRHP